MSDKPRSGSISFQQIMSAAVLALAIFIFVVLAQRLTTSVVLWRQTQQMHAEINAAAAETERLEQRKRYVQTDEYAESVARRDMKLVRPGEVAVIGLPVPAAQPTTTPRDWWERVVGH